MMIPKDVTLNQWASSLAIDFPADNIPILTDENDWKLWGNLLISEKSFSNNQAPGTFGYQSWLPWAQDVFYSMTNF